MKSLIAVLLSFCIVFNSGNIDIALGELQGEGNSNSGMLSKLIYYIVIYLSNSSQIALSQINDVRSGCRNGEVVLSNNRTLAPLDMVQASNSLEGGEAENVYSSGTSTWCTSSRDPNPYIDLQFTSPVLISRMLTRGFTRLRIGSGTTTFSIKRYYVTNFTLEYSSLDNSSILNYYTTTDESGTPSESKTVSG